MTRLPALLGCPPYTSRISQCRSSAALRRFTHGGQRAEAVSALVRLPDGRRASRVLHEVRERVTERMESRRPETSQRFRPFVREFVREHIRVVAIGQPPASDQPFVASAIYRPNVVITAVIALFAFGQPA